MRGKSHDPEVKAQVMAALLAGQLPAEVARTFNLSESLISRWRRTIPVEKLQEVASQKEIDFGHLLADYLEQSLLTIKEQVVFFRDQDWLRKQSASDLAVLHGVTVDKTIRLLEAAERAQE